MNVTADYFKTMGVSIASGRTFSDAETGARSTPGGLVVINQSMARRYFGGASPVGQRVGWGNPPDVRYDLEIIGVVRDAIYGDLRTGARPLMYFPAAGARYLMVRAALPPSRVMGTVRRAIQAVDANLDPDVTTVPKLREQALLLERLLAMLSALFGLIALTLASIGLYGLMAYSVARRTRDIGIRVALGAGRPSVVKLVLLETLGISAVGIAAGACAAWIGTRTLDGILFGVSTMDPLTLVFAVVVLMSVAGLASALPARRAASVDPIVALRHE